MRVRVLHESVTLGAVGDVVDAPDGFLVRPAVRAGLVEVVKSKPKRVSKLAAKSTVEKVDD